MNEIDYNTYEKIDDTWLLILVTTEVDMALHYNQFHHWTVMLTALKPQVVSHVWGKSII